MPRTAKPEPQEKPAAISPTLAMIQKQFEILSLTEQAVLKLLEMDISSKVARSAVKKAIGKSVSGQPLAAVVKRAFKIALNMETEKNLTDIDEQDDDLRKAAGESPYENLKKSGFIAESADEF